MELVQHSNNVHEIKLKGSLVRVAQLSDLHWDNPKCDWPYLKRTLDYCLKENMPIVVNGDFFCLMQGRGDRRGNKSDIRPEHNNAKYLDSVVNTAIDWFLPYAHLFAVIGYGNHETAIIKYQETDILARFVNGLNAKAGTNIQIGGYGGWITYTVTSTGTRRASFKQKYFHGSGGGGVVTRGEINLTRAMAACDGFDIYSMGHVHENKATDVARDTLTHNAKLGYQVQHKKCHMMITGAFKEEYQDGSKGWHIERGAPPKPIGGRIMELITNRRNKKEGDGISKIVRSYKFPF